MMFLRQSAHYKQQKQHKQHFRWIDQEIEKHGVIL